MAKQTQFSKGDHILWRGEDGEFLGLFAEYSDGGNCMIKVFIGERSGNAEVRPDDLTKLEKFDPKLLKTGDAVLVRDSDKNEWSYSLFSHVVNRSTGRYFGASCTFWAMCVPYNKETKELVGTYNKAPKFYDLTEKQD